VKSFQFSLFFLKAVEERLHERGVLLIGNSLIAKQIVVNEHQVQAADHEGDNAVIGRIWLCAVVGIGNHFGLLLIAASICARSHPSA
jgi:hypothetical protein